LRAKTPNKNLFDSNFSPKIQTLITRII